MGQRSRGFIPDTPQEMNFRGMGDGV